MFEGSVDSVQSVTVTVSVSVTVKFKIYFDVWPIPIHFQSSNRSIFNRFTSDSTQFKKTSFTHNTIG